MNIDKILKQVERFKLAVNGSPSFCQDCGTELIAENMSEGLFKNLICLDCFDKSKVDCDDCNQPFDKHKLTIVKTEDGPQKFCEECYLSLYASCPNCDKENVLIEEIYDLGSRWKKDKPKGCDNCAKKCYSCDNWFDNDSNIHKYPDEEYYCEDCSGDHWSNCEECNETVPSEDIYYVESESSTVCSDCYGRMYGRCNECDQDVPKNNLHTANDGESYCEECRPNYDSADDIEEYSGLNKPDSFTYGKNDRQLNYLRKLLPISVKELKLKYPALANSVKDLIVFSGGKDLTAEIVAKFDEATPKKAFKINYTLWNSSLQRSVESELPQLTLNITATDEVVKELQDNNVYNLFDKINATSKESGHPWVKDQIGWARLELDPNKEYILVDEIQTDHMNAIDRINSETHLGETYAHHIKRQQNLTDDQWSNMLKTLKEFIKEFPEMAISAINIFAKENGYKKIYWHTYESGMNLKRNYPPKSLYTETPKRNFFSETEDKPFGLEGKFFSREARMKKMRELLKSGKR